LINVEHVFNPTQHRMPFGCTTHAQSPQALVFRDFIRIYFSTRHWEPTTGKPLSYIAFADFTKDFKTLLRMSQNTVIDLGALGAFDEHGICPMNVLRVDDEVWAYTCGWSRRVSVPIETSIGYAVSKDEGLTFQKAGDGPILGSSLHEPFLVGDPCVQRYGELFHMWYIFGTHWKSYADEKQPQRVYKIGQAVSKDGRIWEKTDGRAIIEDQLHRDECQAHPTVIQWEGAYHMFFCYREPSGFRTDPRRSYRLGYAVSSNLATWRRVDPAVAGLERRTGRWDSDMRCYPHIFESDGKIHLLYNGNQFGREGFGVALLE
jgi:hypothetical protein